MSQRSQSKSLSGGLWCVGRALWLRVKSFYTLVKILTSSRMKSKNIKLEAAGKCVYVCACVQVC